MRPILSELPHDGAVECYLLAVALAVLAPRPAARASHAVLELLLGPPNASLSSHRLLGILDPADELVTSQWRDVLPRIQRGRIREQRIAQIAGQDVHRTTRDSSTAHTS